MAGWTNRGKLRVLSSFFQNDTPPTNFFCALFDSSVAPTVDSQTPTQATLNQVPVGNGYLDGGFTLGRNNTDWTKTEDDANDRAYAQAKDIPWTASGGDLPSSGNGARWACLTTDEVTIGDRHIIGFFDLGADRKVSDTQVLTLQALEFRLTE